MSDMGDMPANRLVRIIDRLKRLEQCLKDESNQYGAEVTYRAALHIQELEAENERLREERLAFATAHAELEASLERVRALVGCGVSDTDAVVVKWIRAALKGEDQ